MRDKDVNTANIILLSTMNEVKRRMIWWYLDKNRIKRVFFLEWQNKLNYEEKELMKWNRIYKNERAIRDDQNLLYQYMCL